MKKRQKPYVLIALLLVAGGAAAFINAPNVPQSAPKPDDTPKTGEDVSVPSKADLQAQANRDLMIKGKGNVPRDQDGKPLPTPPSVLKFKPAPYKPRPTESSTSTQWYTKETPKEFKSPTSNGSPTPSPDQGSKPMIEPVKR